MADDSRPIIIKRIKKVESGHHGGAWKVAYADFVTAMMAFFLLLWLLNAVTEEQKKGIANYFRPSLAIESASATLNILEGQSQPLELTPGGPAAELSPVQDPDSDPTEETAPVSDPESMESPPVAPIDIQQAEAAIAKEEEKRFAEVKSQIEKAIEETPDLKELKQNLLIEQTEEGLRIQLLDREKVSMFPSGSSVMNERSKRLLEKVALAIRGLPNKLSISGHTDATPYVGGGAYTNWELSTDRANASRRVLVEAGIEANRVQTVNGKADIDPLIKADPFAPQNRRISIVLLRENPAGTGVFESPTPDGPKQLTPPSPPPELVPPSGPAAQ